MIRLYDFELSGNCYKIRMLLSMLGLEWERVVMDLRKKAQMEPDFLAINPLRKVPVLVDGDVVIRDSAAIMVYLARKNGRADLYPDDPAGMAEIQQWLSFSVNEVFNGLALVRANVIFNRGMDPEPLRVAAEATLDTLSGRLEAHEWLALDHFTLADLACYPYAALSHQGHVKLEKWPAAQAWFARVEALPGFVAMPGLAGA